MNGPLKSPTKKTNSLGICGQTQQKTTFSYPFNHSSGSYQSFWNSFTHTEDIEVMNICSNATINNFFCEARLFYRVGVFNRVWKGERFEFLPNKKKYVFQIGEHKNCFGHFISCDLTHFLWDIGLSIPHNFKNKKTVYKGQLSYRSENCFPYLWAMIKGLRNYDGKTLESMEMERFWHNERMNWVGPWSIGHLVSLKEFEDHHQIPFLKCIPKRNGAIGKNKVIFSDGNFAASMGYPSMTGSQEGEYFGFIPSGKELNPFVMDFWNCDNKLLIDNWVQIDMLQLWSNINTEFREYMNNFFG